MREVHTVYRKCSADERRSERHNLPPLTVDGTTHTLYSLPTAFKESYIAKENGELKHCKLCFSQS